DTDRVGRFDQSNAVMLRREEKTLRLFVGTASVDDQNRRMIERRGIEDDMRMREVVIDDVNLLGIDLLEKRSRSRRTVEEIAAPVALHEVVENDDVDLVERLHAEGFHARARRPLWKIARVFDAVEPLLGQIRKANFAVVGTDHRRSGVVPRVFVKAENDHWSA